MERRSGVTWFRRLAGLGAAGTCVSGCVAATPPAAAPSVPTLSPASRQVAAAPRSRTGEATQPLTAFQKAMVGSLERQTAAETVYDSSYYRGGVPPAHIGVCSDVAIRAFAAAGVDLKREVTADIRAHQRLYPLSAPDPNIDHRRCRNLVVYFRRHARELPISPARAHWQPGDIVFWSTGGKDYLDHIGIIGNHIGASGNPTVVQHLPGAYVNETDTLYRFQVLHHFRWSG
jgi:uncharacterized protein YijF (DUF1287 family)